MHDSCLHTAMDKSNLMHNFMLQRNCCEGALDSADQL